MRLTEKKLRLIIRDMIGESLVGRGGSLPTSGRRQASHAELDRAEQGLDPDEVDVDPAWIKPLPDEEELPLLASPYDPDVDPPVEFGPVYDMECLLCSGTGQDKFGYDCDLCSGTGLRWVRQVNELRHKAVSFLTKRQIKLTKDKLHLIIKEELSLLCENRKDRQQFLNDLEDHIAAELVQQISQSGKHGGFYLGSWAEVRSEAYPSLGLIVDHFISQVSSYLGEWFPEDEKDIDR